MKIYGSETIDFNNNGLGFLTDIISAEVYEEINGEYELEFEYILNGHLSEYLENENIVKCKVADGTEQLFIITNVEKNLKTIKVTAKHIFYRLLKNMLEDVYPKNLGANAFLNWILDHTQYESGFTGFGDCPGTYSARYVRKNPVEAIIGADNSMCNLFGGELKRDNFTINFLSQIGTDKKEKLVFGKNIKEIKITINDENILTRIMPLGYDALMLPEKYVDSPYIDSYPYPKIGIVNFDDIVYDPESEEAYHDIQEAYQALRNATRQLYTNGIDKPSVNIKIDWLELSKTNEYKNYANLEKLQLGDSVICDIAGINYSTRVISTNYNPLTDTIEKFEIGTFSPNIASAMNNLNRVVEKVNPTTILEEAKNNATSLITQAMGGYIYKTQNELYIMDTNDPTTATKVWRWNINGLGYSRNGINGPYELAMTMDGSIVADMITTGQLNTNVITGYDNLIIQVRDNTDAIGDRSTRTSTITQDIASLEAQIGDIADITTSANTTTAYIEDSELMNVAASYPIRIEIRPINEDISYLYPNSGLYPSSTLFSKIRKLRFTNTLTNQIFDYVLPDDLLYYDENNYDSLVADYEANTVTIVKKCQYNSDGAVSLLSTPVTTYLNFMDEIGSKLALTEGSYRVELLGYDEAFIFVRLMVINAYTAMYATKVELQSGLNMTSTSIREYVDAEIVDINGEIDNVHGELELKLAKTDTGGLISMLNASADEITLAGGSKIALNTPGKLTINAGNFRLDNQGNMTCSNANITGGNIFLTGEEAQNPKFTIRSSTNNNILMSILPVALYFERNGSRIIQINAALSSPLISLFNRNNTSLKNQISSDFIEISNGSTKTTITPTSVTPGSLEESKKNFEKLDNALNIIKNTDIYRYNFKDETNETKKHIGFVIGKDYNYSHDITGIDGNGKEVGADLYSMVSVCFKAIQEQQEIIEQLQKEIKELKNEK